MEGGREIEVERDGGRVKEGRERDGGEGGRVERDGGRERKRWRGVRERDGGE